MSIICLEKTVPIEDKNDKNSIGVTDNMRSRLMMKFMISMKSDIQNLAKTNLTLDRTNNWKTSSRRVTRNDSRAYGNVTRVSKVNFVKIIAA